MYKSVTGQNGKNGRQRNRQSDRPTTKPDIKRLDTRTCVQTATQAVAHGKADSTTGRLHAKQSGQQQEKTCKNMAAATVPEFRSMPNLVHAASHKACATKTELFSKRSTTTFNL